MTALPELIEAMTRVPTSHLGLLVAGGALVVAGFAIHAVLTLAKQKGDR